MRNRWHSDSIEENNDNRTITPSDIDIDNDIDITNKKEEKRNSSQKFLDRRNPLLQEAINAIPKNRRVKMPAFQDAWASFVVGVVDERTAILSIKRYYESPEGKGRHYRQPATLIYDAIWENEDESVWASRDGEDKPAEKFPECPRKHKEIINDYCAQNEGERERIDTLIAKHNQDVAFTDNAFVAKIAYKIWVAKKGQ